MKTERTCHADGSTTERKCFPDGRTTEQTRFPEGRTEERTYYPDGRIEGEVTLVDGRPHGTTRHWHPNGVLASEIPLDHGIIEGMVRQWDDSGELIGSCEIRKGTGIYRIWHPNGNLMGETSMIDGKWTGRQLAYFEDGELCGETYWLEDEKVSKKRYREACARDPSLPLYEPIKKSKFMRDAAKPSRKARSVNSVPPEDTVAKLLDGAQVREAMSWLMETRQPSRSLGEATGQDESLRLVKKLYGLGAVAVHAVNILGRVDEDQNTGQLVVELPRNRESRKQLLRFCGALARKAGFDPDFDVNQKRTLLMLD